jgi:hypothetical protein
MQSVVPSQLSPCRDQCLGGCTAATDGGSRRQASVQAGCKPAANRIRRTVAGSWTACTTRFPPITQSLSRATGGVSSGRSRRTHAPFPLTPSMPPRTGRRRRGNGMFQSAAARVFAAHRSAVNRWCQVAVGRRGGRPEDPDAGPQARRRAARPGPRGRVARHHPPPIPGRPRAVRRPLDSGGGGGHAAERFGVRKSRWAWGRWRRHDFTPQRPARTAYRQAPADLAWWRPAVYPGVAAGARRCGAEVHRLDGAGTRATWRIRSGRTGGWCRSGGIGLRHFYLHGQRREWGRTRPP